MPYCLSTSLPTLVNGLYNVMGEATEDYTLMYVNDLVCMSNTFDQNLINQRFVERNSIFGIQIDNNCFNSKLKRKKKQYKIFLHLEIQNKLKNSSQWQIYIINLLTDIHI